MKKLCMVLLMLSSLVACKKKTAKQDETPVLNYSRMATI